LKPQPYTKGRSQGGVRVTSLPLTKHRGKGDAAYEHLTARNEHKKKKGRKTSKKDSHRLRRMLETQKVQIGTQKVSLLAKF